MIFIVIYILPVKADIFVNIATMEALQLESKSFSSAQG